MNTARNEPPTQTPEALDDDKTAELVAWSLAHGWHVLMLCPTMPDRPTKGMVIVQPGNPAIRLVVPKEEGDSDA